MVTFTSRDDAREAYRAGLSGAKDFTAKSKDAEIAFFQGAKSNIENTQGDRPEDFKDEVYGLKTGTGDDYSTKIKVLKSGFQKDLENLQNQDDAFKFLNEFNNRSTFGLLDRDVLNYIKAPLSGIGAFTTDPNEGRNVYQLLINKMFQGDRDQMRGAQPLAQGDVAGMRRLGRTLFRDPNVNVSFAENLKSLLPFVTNPGVVNIRDMPGGGIANLPEFGQQGLDFTREQGFRDYGATLENLAKLAVPAPLRAVLSEAGQMGDDVLLTPFKNLFNIGGEEEVVQEEPEEKKKRFFFFGDE
tara:strand:- start:194 stop:1090 length:897 start_codon:yes stop_codon:yes gene_type:complete